MFPKGEFKSPESEKTARLLALNGEAQMILPSRDIPAERPGWCSQTEEETEKPNVPNVSIETKRFPVSLNCMCWNDEETLGSDGADMHCGGCSLR